MNTSDAEKVGKFGILYDAWFSVRWFDGILNSWNIPEMGLAVAAGCGWYSLTGSTYYPIFGVSGEFNKRYSL
ncbi:hypothetical protein [Thermococcus sp.]